ncbi:barstar family protein [Empedobacter falsenii]|uniref:Barstar (Barnase inhibitor) n=1 Tax=Empedobacter falsenii TaxID=343874 RepID=A0A376GJ05_9FLAO|nr:MULTISPECIES: barstar family protein [Empedobacter]MDM1039967.1 barstar family protein [Empedobacter brevis]MDM1133899.1 barstar family protein [Empedobacter sp. R750]STD58923.1 Barstar (barnase inhibitor) [Empedobacter falsenii]
MKKEIQIDGAKIQDLTSLYKEFNDKLMPNEDWELGESLDALDDLLYGGFGEINGNEAIRLVWTDFERMKEFFGYDFTLNFYQNKLKYPEIFNKDLIKNSIDELQNGNGKTYFEIILEIIESHSNIELVTK